MPRATPSPPSLAALSPPFIFPAPLRVFILHRCFSPGRSGFLLLCAPPPQLSAGACGPPCISSSRPLVVVRRSIRQCHSRFASVLSLQLADKLCRHKSL